MKFQFPIFARRFKLGRKRSAPAVLHQTWANAYERYNLACKSGDTQWQHHAWLALKAARTAELRAEVRAA